MALKVIANLNRSRVESCKGIQDSLGFEIPPWIPDSNH